MKTLFPSLSEITREWQVVDASGQVLGRLASRVARLLMGKHKPIWTPNLDTGDYVIVINAAQVRVTGKKAKEKVYYRHSGYPGGLKETTFRELHSRHPERVVKLAVKGMLPKNALGRAMFRRLKVYAGSSHPHQGQVKNG